jgi:hypothetical protein
MNFRHVVLALLIGSLLWASCQKNSTSKIPFITLTAFVPDSIRNSGLDTPYIQFHLTDGDGDIGVDSGTSAIFIMDSRFDSVGYQKQAFPNIDGSIEDAKKGLEGDCTFFLDPIPSVRTDSIHLQFGDTLVYHFYITDRAGHHSDTITTHPLRIRP